VFVVGPFEKDEEGMEGEDPAIPGSRRGGRARWHVGDPFRGYMLLGPTPEP